MGGVLDTLAQVAVAPAKLVGDIADKIPVVGPYIVPTALSLAGQPELAAAYQGIHSGLKTGSPLGGLESAIGTYAGSSLGASLGEAAGNTFGGVLSKTPANALGDIFGGENIGSIAPFGSFAGNALGGSTIGSMLGSGIGGQIGGNIGQPINPSNSNGGQSPPGFSPSRSPQMALPQGLSQFSSLDPFQQATNIASKGVYGGGQGSDENQYFLNLINRQLVDPSGNVQNQSSLNPVENSYLSQLGLGGYNNSTDLLKGISQYQG